MFRENYTLTFAPKNLNRQFFTRWRLYNTISPLNFLLVWKHWWSEKYEKCCSFWHTSIFRVIKSQHHRLCSFCKNVNQSKNNFSCRSSFLKRKQRFFAWECSSVKVATNAISSDRFRFSPQFFSTTASLSSPIRTSVAWFVL